jgi:hypothetical protein
MAANYLAVGPRLMPMHKPITQVESSSVHPPSSFRLLWSITSLLTPQSECASDNRFARGGENAFGGSGRLPNVKLAVTQ